jgi:NTP pyrophosphatase (non-canonical NTP hydrolase)
VRKGPTLRFSEYQQRLKAFEHERDWDRVLPSHTFLHMGEELGEIGRILQCLEGYRDTDLGREALCELLAGELSDLTAFVFKLASQHGIDMDETMQAHLQKLLTRYHDIEQGQREMARYVAYQEKNLQWLHGQHPPHPEEDR